MKKYVALAALMASLASPALAQTAPMAVPLDRAGFRQMAMASDGFEIASSRLALQRSHNPRVRAFAQKMITDHAATSAALNGGNQVYSAEGDILGGSAAGALAGAGIGALVGGPVGAAVGAGIGGATGATAGAAAAPGQQAGGTVTGTLAGAGVGAVVGGPVGAAVGAGIGATTGAAADAVDRTGAVSTQMRTAVPLTPQESAMLNRLASARGKQFDRLYGDYQRQAHRKAIAMFQAYAANGSDPAMVQFTQSVLPHLEQHLAMARRLPG